MNKFIYQNFCRIFQQEYAYKHVQEKEENGSTSEKLILKVLKDMYMGTDTVSFNELWSVLSDDMLKRLSETSHFYR